MKKYPVIKVLVPYQEVSNENGVVERKITIANPNVLGYKPIKERDCSINRTAYREIQLVPDFVDLSESGNAKFENPKAVYATEVTVTKFLLGWGGSESIWPSHDAVAKPKVEPVPLPNPDAPKEEPKPVTSPQMEELTANVEAAKEFIESAAHAVKTIESEKSWFNKWESAWLMMFRPVLVIISSVWMLPLLLITVWPRIAIVVRFRRMGKKLKRELDAKAKK